MTLVRVLPNRYIVLLMTPREASMLEGQILDPGEWPWQDTEAHMVGQDVKWKLHEAVADMAAMELDKSLTAVVQMAEAQRQREEAEKQEANKPPPPPPGSLQVTPLPAEAPEDEEEEDGIHRAVPRPETSGGRVAPLRTGPLRKLRSAIANWRSADTVRISPGCD